MSDLSSNIGNDQINKIIKQNKNLLKLSEITKSINASLDISKLLNSVMESIKNIMNTEAGSLLFYDNRTDELVFKVAVGEMGSKLTEKYRFSTNEGLAGWCAKNKKPVSVKDAYSDSRFNPSFDKMTGFITKSIICVPLLFKGKLLGVLEGINPVDREYFTDEDMEIFTLFADQAVMAVQNAMIFDKAIEESRLQKEFETARNIKEKLIECEKYETPNLKISASSITAREIGGEFYDIHSFKDGCIGVSLCDTHHVGIPGAIYSSLLYGSVKALVDLYGKNPIKLASKLGLFYNERFAYLGEISFFYCLVDTKNHIMEFINTGFTYPILYRDGVSRYLKFNTHTFNPAIKVERQPLKKVRLKLREKDLIILVTDGIVNMKNEKLQQFGLKKTIDVINSIQPEPQMMIDGLLEEIKKFSHGPSKRDDITIVCFKVE